MEIITARCLIRDLKPEDADFIFSLLNSPGWLEFIGDRAIKTLQDAADFIQNGPVNSYRENGFGLWMVQDKFSGAKLGLCGFLKRPQLDFIDLGYAFLPEYNSQGFAGEAADAVLLHGKNALHATTVLAFTNPKNERSIRLLMKLGYQFQRMLPWPDSVDLNLYVLNLSDYASKQSST